MRPVNDPYGGVNPLIDKMIGNAYDIVKYVARYLKEIRYVAENMEHVFIAANGNRVMLSAEGNGSASLSITIPVSVGFSSIQDVSVIAISGSNIYMPSPQTFNFSIANGKVDISIGNYVPALVNATYKITLTTNSYME